MNNLQGETLKFVNTNAGNGACVEIGAYSQVMNSFFIYHQCFL